LETANRVPAEFLDGLAIADVGLPLYLGKRRALEVGLPFEDPESIGSLDAADLVSIAAKDDAERTLLRQTEQVEHLAAGDHAGLVDNEHLASCCDLKLLVLKEAVDRDRLAESDFLQLLDSGHRRGGGKDVVAGFLEASPEFLESGRLARAGGAAEVDRAVFGIEDEADGVFLFRPQAVG
jgi:hypothetical protein